PDRTGPVERLLPRVQRRGRLSPRARAPPGTATFESSVREESGLIGGIVQVVDSGPLLLALPVAAAAGAVTFLSPCCLPLVPGYLSYVTGMSGADAGRAATGGVAEPAARTGETRAAAGGTATLAQTAAVSRAAPA